MNLNTETHELRIGILGSVDSGKSTLIGALTSDKLDNGRGLLRKNVLKHPHEQETGRTSDISQKYIKLSYNDINNNEINKVVGFIDLAGHEKYLKTTISGVNRCNIDYAIIVIGANMGVLKMTKEHLTICLSLGIPTMVVITKTDIAPSNILKKTITTLYKFINGKSKGKITPYMIDNETMFNEDIIQKYYNINKYSQILPIFKVSNVDGSNIKLLKNCISKLPIYKNYEMLKLQDANFVIENTYIVKGIGLVLSGVLNSGVIKKGETLCIGPFDDKFYNIQIRSIHNNFYEHVDYLEAGQGGCLNVTKHQIKRNQIRKGIRILKNGISYKYFEAEVKITHHPTTINVGYEPTIHTDSVCQTAKIINIIDNTVLRLGCKAKVVFEFCHKPEYIQENSMIIFRDGMTKGFGRILKVY